ncbi:hypothetical protein [Phocaeicola vulgatus]|uniref:hypothetical protein n=1 Tax=Phocaeicola vulgatus TaxID=821 RepID=UPI0035620E27
MIAFYDNQPTKLEAVGNGSYVYRFNIEELVPVLTEENAEEKKVSQWKCEEVTVWSPLSSNKITEAVITEKWDNNQEQKLVNEYNAANLGMLGAKTSEEAKARIEAYKAYLTERASLKAQVDNDCLELGIL